MRGQLADTTAAKQRRSTSGELPCDSPASRWDRMRREFHLWNSDKKPKPTSNFSLIMKKKKNQTNPKWRGSTRHLTSQYSSQLSRAWTRRGSKKPRPENIQEDRKTGCNMASQMDLGGKGTLMEKQEFGEFCSLLNNLTNNHSSWWVHFRDWCELVWPRRLWQSTSAVSHTLWHSQLPLFF